MMMFTGWLVFGPALAPSVFLGAMVCSHCSSEFTGRKRKYCSDQCRLKACRDKKRERAIMNGTAAPRYSIQVMGRECTLCREFKHWIAYLPYSKATTGYRGECKECRNEAKRQDRKKRARPVRKDKFPHRQMDALAERNAVQAFKHWLYEKAPDAWVEEYYQAMGKQWLNHRLSAAEKYRIRYEFDHEFAIKERIRRQIKKKENGDGIAEVIRGAIRNGGNSPTVENKLGYSISDLKKHLERQFNGGMSWDHFMQGKIHIDHIIPQKQFDLSNREEWKQCWALPNLMPLWAKDNLKKQDKLLFLI